MLDLRKTVNEDISSGGQVEKTWQTCKRKRERERERERKLSSGSTISRGHGHVHTFTIKESTVHHLPASHVGLIVTKVLVVRKCNGLREGFGTSLTTVN